MKLTKYVPVYADKFASFTRQEVHSYIKHVRVYCEYNSLENYVLWRLFHKLNCDDNFATCDEIHAKYPGVKDAHILTMLKAAFKECFGSDVETFGSSAL